MNWDYTKDMCECGHQQTHHESEVRGHGCGYCPCEKFRRTKQSEKDVKKNEQR